MEKVQIIPPPKDVDPRVLAWKGAAVLGKMDGVADLWITAEDWVSLLYGTIIVPRTHATCAGCPWYARLEGTMLLSVTHWGYKEVYCCYSAE